MQGKKGHKRLCPSRARESTIGWCGLSYENRFIKNNWIFGKITQKYLAFITTFPSVYELYLVMMRWSLKWSDRFHQQQNCIVCKITSMNFAICMMDSFLGDSTLFRELVDRWTFNFLSIINLFIIVVNEMCAFWYFFFL